MIFKDFSLKMPVLTPREGAGVVEFNSRVRRSSKGKNRGLKEYKLAGFLGTV